MILSDVMDEIAARLGFIQDLRTYEFPPDKIEPPAAVVSYPDEITFDGTYSRGADTLLLPVVVVVGRASDRAARDLISVYVDGDGASSFKRVLESKDLPAYTAFDSVRVVKAQFDVVRIGGVDYVAAMFDLDIIGSG